MKKQIMKRAWEIAKEGQKKFGGKVKEYFAIALKFAWKEVKAAEAGTAKAQLKGTPKQVAWAEAIRQNVISYIEICFEKGLEWYEAREGENERIAQTKKEGIEQFKEIQKMLYGQSDAEYWIDEWQANYKNDWKISEGIKFMLWKLGEDKYRRFDSVLTKGKNAFKKEGKKVIA